ncbi:TPA: hypothetical protein N0F65_006550 [Lagenidium giganteum]|uniref:Uncharacterized protein n=1 Tax=Lagenidium giganteum TaxID=4803 RepID=A0AAV2YL19_9STRA|nr:TPA: hypothetical protein N0F65_006550 [Lagenidium giganteum]
MEEQWAWVREALDSVDWIKVRQQAKVFFMQSLQASTASDMTVILEEMEAWRDQVEREARTHKLARSERRELESLSRALFMLAVDKNLDLSRES